jgi:DNA-binding transcriptional LysR family regulator
MLRQSRPTIALRTDVDIPDRLLDRVQNGSLDIAILYTPKARPFVEIVRVVEEDLIAVTSSPVAVDLATDDYVFVDWGPDFTAQHDAEFPGLKDASLRVGLGPLALRYILAVGGAGYFRTRAVQRYLESGQLHRVPSTPTFSYSAYAAYSTRADHELVSWAREALGNAASTLSDPWL